ncbi:type I secretion system permease/ATPase [Rhodovulum sp. BSW8]|uniref:type I secretion system permease/ATPase n=1 Tax=Rhodovulum sp. BSW8 TaxID=2259645 RepID=UPI000DE242AD|nr:type I secretion system permease/ATPase [Rhodovulum sp. BSW8]RBO55159.1 type I secretion system permease/ATPase [Rhodovulum sp. BSW8]
MMRRADPAGRLDETLRDLLRGGVAAGAVGFFVNLLHLGLPLFTIQVYSRVLSSGSVETLTALAILALTLLAFQTLLDVMRQRIFVILANRTVARLGKPVFEAAIESSLTKGPQAASGAMQDVSELRAFLAGGALALPLDLAFAPVFLLALFLLHPVYGFVGLGGALALAAAAIATELLLRGPSKEGTQATARVNGETAEAIRHAELITSMGMLPALARRWRAAQNRAIEMSERGAKLARLLSTLTRTLRVVLQIAVIGSAAYLVIEDRVSASTIFAATVLTGRLLLPFEQTASGWKQWLEARAVLDRLKGVTRDGVAARSATPVEIESGRLVAERLSYFAPGGGSRPVLQNINFSLESGMMMGVIGPSGAGKSSLSRLIVGIAQPSAGGLYLDGQSTFAHERESFGRAVGYLPQEPTLLTGTVRDNIARFGDHDMAAVVRAARAAGVHELIGSLPQGYATPLGSGGHPLSGGQRQRIALARALIGTPRLIVLDEPNSNLDAEGEAALVAAIETARAAGATVVVVAQRMSILNRADRLLRLQDGAMVQFGPRDEVMQALTPQRPQPPRRRREIAS